MKQATLPLITLSCWLYAYFHLYRASRLQMGSPAQAAPVSSSAIHGEAGLGSNASNVFTFVQISDIHISRNIRRGGLAHFGSFLARELPLLSPALLLLSGDLINAETASKMQSEQYQDEWNAYESLVRESKISLRNNGSFYFDQRGNHDCFNTNSTLFEKHSATKLSNGYTHTHTTPFGTYAFAALDACPSMGTSRPINFFGTLDHVDMNLLASVVDTASLHHYNHTFVLSHYPTSTMSIGASSDGRDFDTLAQSVSLWMSGHLHKLVGGKVVMYGYHESTNLLELELGDMKDNAVYRIVAVDNDMIAVSDEVISLPQIPAPVTHDIQQSPPTLPQPTDIIQHPRSPLILITNPRDARFATPTHEPVHKILSSTHIRFLAYPFAKSQAPIPPQNIKISIDDIDQETVVEYVGTTKPWSDIRDLEQSTNHIPLYIARWNPQLFNDGRDHSIEISVTDDEEHTAMKRIIFRVDGQRAKNHGMESGIGGYVIAASFEKLFKGLFVFAHLFIAILLHVPKLFVDYAVQTKTYGSYRSHLMRRLQHLSKLTETPFIRPLKDEDDLMETGHLEESFPQPGLPVSGLILAHIYRLAILWTIRFMNFAHTPRLYFPFFVYFNYLIVGPWFVGNLVPSAQNMSDRVGLCYVYGLWFAGGHGWVPLLDTWYLALWEHTSFIFPLILLLAYVSPPPPRLNTTTRQTGILHFISNTCSTIIPPALLTLWFIATAFFSFYGWTYGYLSVILSPGKMWMCCWAAWVLGVKRVVVRGLRKTQLVRSVNARLAPGWTFAGGNDLDEEEFEEQIEFTEHAVGLRRRQ
ncbi:Transmembrane protein 62 [Chytriomyces hyalinus]|nr:Transmembrane protein 62 [Chytriomyces hyalinus]